MKSNMFLHLIRNQFDRLIARGTMPRANLDFNDEKETDYISNVYGHFDDLNGL